MGIGKVYESAPQSSIGLVQLPGTQQIHNITARFPVRLYRLYDRGSHFREVVPSHIPIRIVISLPHAAGSSTALVLAQQWRLRAEWRCNLAG